MCEYIVVSAEESSWHVQLGLTLNDVARMGRGLLFTQCRKVTATGNVSGNSMSPGRLPVGKVIIAPMQMYHIP